MKEKIFYWITRITSFAFFYFGWWIALQQASVGNALIGPLVILAMFSFQLFFTEKKMPDIILALTAIIVGTLIDSVYCFLGFLAYKSPYAACPKIAPLWVASIWVLYAMCLNHSLVWLRGRWFISAVCGALGAFFSYLAGIRLGAAENLVAKETVLITVSLVWAVITPLSLWYAEKVDKWCDRKQSLGQIP